MEESCSATFGSMSRVGNRLINIPDGVSFENKESQLMVKGPNGSLMVNLCDEISVNIDDKVMNLSRNSEDKVAKSMHGTTRQLISNAIEGVTNGFSKHLEIIGVGFNVKSQSNRLIFQLGFSHDIAFDLPEGIEAVANKTSLEIKGADKQLVGQVAAKIRSLKKPEPYKGKGIRYKSTNHIEAQIIDDFNQKTIVSASSKEKEFSKKKVTKTELAALVGASLSKRVKGKKINKIYFDRNGFRYHGRVKSLADAAREGGLKF